MISRRLLFFGYYFPPYASGGVYRLLKFVRYLPLFSWIPTVITPVPKKYYWAFDDSLLNEIPPTINVQRTYSLEPFYLWVVMDKLKLTRLRDHALAHLLIPDDKIGWIPSALRRALQLVRRQSFDMIFTSSPPNSIHLIGYALKKLTGLPWIADYRDQWTLNPLYSRSGRLAKRLDFQLEKKVCQNSDRIIHVTPSDRFDVAKKFQVHPEKIAWIPNGYDSDDFQIESVGRGDNRFVLGHFGNIYGGRKRTMAAFLDGASLAVQSHRGLAGKLHIEFYGNSNIDPKLVNYPQLKPNITLQQLVPHKEAVRKMINSDVLLFFLGEEDKNVITSKLYEYMAANKPILALVPDGDAKKMLEPSGLGYFAETQHPEKIKALIIDLFELLHQNKLLIKSNRIFIEQFERKKLSAQLADELNAVLSNVECKN